jgi:hypothetical protein
LLVAFIPGLLMLATFGLERLESGLNHDTLSATDVAEFLKQARADDVRTLARDGMPHALDCLHRRLQPDPGSAAVDKWPHLPIPLYVYNRGNTEFQPTRHANRV